MDAVPVAAMPLIALGVDAKVDRETGKQKKSATGVPQWSVHGSGVVNGKAAALTVTVAALEEPEVEFGAPVQFVGLMAHQGPKTLWFTAEGLA